MQVLNENIVPLLKGEKGDGLEIKKWYASVEAMNADYSNSDIAVGDSVAINETLDLYIKGASAFEHKGSLKGEQGKDGTGLNIKKWYTDTTTMNADYSNPDIAVGDSVAIDSTLDLYVKGASAFEYKGTLKGKDGDKGDDGTDGTTFTPSVSAEGVISWTNDGGKSNPTAVNIKGAIGDNGDDGTTFTPSVDSAGNLSWTNDGGKENPTTVNIKGQKGDDGTDGTTFTPSVSTLGNLSWTNDGGKENPPTVNIKGAKGDTGKDALVCLQTGVWSGVPDIGLGGAIDSGDFNRTPSVGDAFLYLFVVSSSAVPAEDAGRSFVALCEVTSIDSSGVWYLIRSYIETTGAKGDSGLTDEQIQMFTYLAQHMTVDQENGKITFSCEVAGAAFDAISED